MRVIASIVKTRYFQRIANRKFADALPSSSSNNTAVSTNVVKESAKSSASAASKDGSSFSERFGSFLAGLGAGFGISFYFIYEELQDSNKRFGNQLKAIAKSQQ